MNSAGVREALYKRWPATQYVVVEEAPEDPMRAGRKIDMLVISCWKSRGYEVEAVEIKVSVSDWKRELDNPSKADFWYRHAHRFWLACPAEIASKVRETLPVGWGLLSVGEKVVAVANPQRNAAEPLSWPTVIGVLRANQGVGLAALQRMHRAGYDEGRAAGRSEAERERGESFLQDQLRSLQERVKAFHEVTGVDLMHAYNAEGAARIGRLYKLIDRSFTHPDHVLTGIDRASAQLAQSATGLTQLRSALAEVLNEEVVAS